MKIYPFYAILLSVCFVACHSNNDEDFSSVSNSQRSNVEVSLNDNSQKTFLCALDSISKNYQRETTRLSQKSVYKFSRWGLLAIADGVGGAIGSGVASWFTSAAVSAAYDAYLDHMQNKMRKVGPKQIEDSAISTTVGTTTSVDSVINNITFVFCDDTPLTADDSIGYAHNELLTKMYDNAEAVSTYITEEGVINYDSIFSECMRSAIELGYPTDELVNIDRNKFEEFCNTLISSLNALQDGKTDSYFEEMGEALYNNNEVDADFISALAELMNKTLSEKIDYDNIIPFCKQVNSSMKEAGLSEKDFSVAKKLLQVSVCSFVYWQECNEQVKYSE